MLTAMICYVFGQPTLPNTHSKSPSSQALGKLRNQLIIRHHVQLPPGQWNSGSTRPVQDHVRLKLELFEGNLKARVTYAVVVVVVVL